MITKKFRQNRMKLFDCLDVGDASQMVQIQIIYCINNPLSGRWDYFDKVCLGCVCCSVFYTKGRPLVKSNLICPLDKLSWQPGCPVLNINIQGNFCISQGNGSLNNLPENLV